MSNAIIQPKQPKLLNYKNLNIEKYEYLLPHKTQNGYYQSICNYRLNKNQILPFYFETPKLKTTSGIVRIDNKFYMDFELSQSGDIGLFNDFLIKNDDNNISVCHENSKEWFNQTMPLNIVEEYYKSPIIKKPNGQLPIFRVRLPCYKGNILTEIFNVRKEKIHDISCIQEGDLMIGILEFSGLMFMSQNFTPCYELHKIKLFKDNDTRLLTSGYIFSDMNEKVDLDIKNNIRNDTIMEDPFSIASQDIKDGNSRELSDPFLDTSALNIKTVSLTANTKPKKTLFDMIKETSLRDFIIDEKLFNNNNKLFNKRTTNNIPEPNEKQEEAKTQIQEESIPIQGEANEIQEEANIIQIQNIDNIDLDIDYNLESPETPSSPNLENDMSYNINSDNIDNIDNQDLLTILNNYEKSEEQQYEEDEDEEDEEEDDENEEEDDEEEEEDGEEEEEEEDEGNIDYETLNDLEVMVFDE